MPRPTEGSTSVSSANDQESRNRAGMRLLATIVRAGGSLPADEVTRVTTQSGYATPGSWCGFLTGASPLLTKSGGDVVITAAGWTWLASVLLPVAELDAPTMNALGVNWP
jgi:hypothetical protein